MSNERDQIIEQLCRTFLARDTRADANTRATVVSLSGLIMPNSIVDSFIEVQKMPEPTGVFRLKPDD